jgi:hypothetical protein
MTTTSLGGGYTATFNGTSSACPTAAGVVGLMLSANPTLTRADVQTILQATADDEVGPPAEDPPGWDQWMGWGRVNAFRAVEAVSNLDPPDIVGVTPNSGPIASNQTVTISGANFFGQMSVMFGTKAAVAVEVTGPSTLLATTPKGDVLGPVDVTVSNAFGSDILAGGYSYTAQYSAIGTPVIGQPFSWGASGPPGGRWGAILDITPGPAMKKGLVWCIGFSPAWEVAHNAWAGDGVLNGLGQGIATWNVPNDPGLVGQTLYSQAVFDHNGPLPGKILIQSGCVQLVIGSN